MDFETPEQFQTYLETAIAEASLPRSITMLTVKQNPHWECLGYLDKEPGYVVSIAKTDTEWKLFACLAPETQLNVTAPTFLQLLQKMQQSLV